MLTDLVRLFASDRPLLESRGAFILRRLCMLLDARLVFTSLASILTTATAATTMTPAAAAGGGDAAATATRAAGSGALVSASAARGDMAVASDSSSALGAASSKAAPAAAAGSPHPQQPMSREFVSLTVELLNLILLTAVETSDLRESLRGCALRAADADAAGVFMALYSTWCINPVATIALCLLANAYELCARLVASLAERSITVGVLMQVDKLVQLLESPVFVTTRMHLTQPARVDHASLLRALYGLLMVLPQGTAYHTLRDRLSAVAALTSAASHERHSSGHKSAAQATALSFDADAAFASFAALQLAQSNTFSAELRGRSVLRRRQQQAAVQQRTGGSGGPPAEESITTDTLPTTAGR